MVSTPSFYRCQECGQVCHIAGWGGLPEPIDHLPRHIDLDDHFDRLTRQQATAELNDG